MPKGLPLSSNPNWKGGRTLASNGYWLVKMPDHPLTDCRGYVYEHRAVAMEALGRVLRHGEVVHHRNGNKQDNRPDNLEVIASSGQHMNLHAKRTDLRKIGEPNAVVDCECGCGAAFARFDSEGRPRRFVSGHNRRRNPVTGRFI